MRITFTIFLILLVYSGSSQKIIKVGVGEYFTSYLTDDGDIYTVTSVGRQYKAVKMPLQNMVDVDGAQYTNVAMDKQGCVYVIGREQSGKVITDKVMLQNGVPFAGNEKVYGWYKTYLSLKNGQIYIWGEDLLFLNNSKTIAFPVALPLPKGKKVMKAVPLTMNVHSILTLMQDGSVWIYYRNEKMPRQVLLSNRARDIAGLGAACYVVETNNDLLAWGFLGSYLGLNDMLTSPVSIKQQWVKAGCKFPSKQLSGNYNTLHIIDANDHLFGAGENVQGEVGNGKQWPDWEKYPSPYAWSWNHGEMIQKPVQINGKFKNLNSGNSIAFYHYVQDMGDNWYSWGRNKARCLGNGITLTIDDESKYPNALNVPAPLKVDPLKVSWQIKKMQELTFGPIANAGVDQYITTSIANLNASYSSQDGGSITNYQWRVLKGNGKIKNANASLTSVEGLSKGENSFQLIVTNHRNQTDTAVLHVYVR